MSGLAIIGGGRWARTIAHVTARLPDGPQAIHLYSRYNADDARAWAAQPGLAGRVHVHGDIPDYGAFRPQAVIIANRAADHVAAAQQALTAGIPVLVEKPLAIGAQQVRELEMQARTTGVYLAASHVFLFARYLENFAYLIAGAGPIQDIHLDWQDARGEMVRGEVKTYDTAVPIFDDVLPHALPILERIGAGALSLASLAIEGGGAQVKIAASGRTPVAIHLARNGESRRRILTVRSQAGLLTLDFSHEPGVIKLTDGASQTGDPAWDRAPGPLAAMLTAFWTAARGGSRDERLSPRLAFASAVFADAVRAQYLPLRRSWLSAARGTKEDICYAEAETRASGQG